MKEISSIYERGVGCPPHGGLFLTSFSGREIVQPCRDTHGGLRTIELEELATFFNLPATRA